MKKMNFRNLKKGLALSSSKGFTLIELLVVIAIIGVMSTIVLNSLSSSRTKAVDSAIKQQLSRYRAAAEIYFNNQTPPGYYNAGTLNSCTTGTDTVFNSTTEGNGSPGLYLNFNNIAVGVTPVCNAVSNAYAVQANLPGGGYWCVDSTGISKYEASVLGASTICS